MLENVLKQIAQALAKAGVTKPPDFDKRVGEMEGVFDPKKIERAFFNLMRNACEATAQRQGQIRVELHRGIV